MTEEMGREFTGAELIALATGETTIMDIVHGIALDMDEARRAEVHVVMPSGVVITRGELEDEIRSTRVATRSLRPVAARTWILGVNASTNMLT